jgi:hypothetical protein
VKRRTIALLGLLALLSLGLGGCHTEGGGPCCWEGRPQLAVAGSVEPCCQPSAPPALPEASGGPWTKAPFSPGLAAFATVRVDLVALEAFATLPGSAARPRPLFTLDCALRL